MFGLRTLVAPLCLGLLAACASATDVTQSEQDLVDPNNSNIRSPDIGTITQLKLLPNTNVPRAALVGLNGSAASQTFVTELHEHLRTINEAEGLAGADGYRQQINLIVATTRARYEQVLVAIRARMGLPAGAKAPLIDLVENVSDDDIWMQDFGEFAAVQGQNAPGQTWYGLLDAGRGRGIDVGVLGSKLGIPVTKLNNPPSGGAYGGNTEATPEGRLYIGDAAPTSYIEGLKRLGNQDAVVLPSAWLRVGHVDEYTQVVPARGACGGALLAASSLEAMNMARRSPAAYASVAPGIGAAMDAFATTRRAPGEDYRMSDFDMSRSPTTSEAAFVKQNLVAEQAAQTAIQRLSAASCIGQQVIRLPQLYELSAGKGVAATPGTVNSLILRSHAIVPDPHIDELRDVIRARYAEALGSGDNVHFIDDTLYHEALGEVHCGTNVIREPAMPYRF